MPRTLKFVLIGLASLVVLLVAVAAIVAATFDPNDYKPLIVKLVQEKKQRTLDIPGRIKLTFFPKIGADLGKVSLSERGGKDAFASVESARVSVALLPLLRKQVVVDRVAIDGIRANLRRRKDGSTNFDDLAGGEDQTAPKDQQVLVLAVDGVNISNADIVYEDETGGARYELAGATLKIGKIGDGVSDDFSFKGRVRSKSPLADADVSLKTKYTMSLAKKQIGLRDVSAEISGTLAEMKNVAAGLSANADVQLSPLAASLSAVAVSFKAKQTSGDLAAKLDVPVLKYAGDEVQAPKLSADVTLPGASGAMHVVAAGDASANLAKQTAAANLAGKVDESNFTAKLAVEKFSPMTYGFDVSVDQLDVDRYTGKPAAASAPKAPAKEAAAKAGAAKAPAAPEKPIDLSALKDLNAHGSAKIGKLKVAGLSASNVQLQLRAAGGKADVSPLAADLYQGKLAGSVSVVAVPVRVATKQALTGVSVGPLLKDLMGKEQLEGRGNVTLDVTSQGDTVSALKKALAGTARIDLRDGAIRGVNVAQAIRSAKTALGRGGEGAGKSEEKTDFSELSGSFRIANGVAHNDDLALKSPLVRVGGSGDVDVGRDRLDYTVKATVVSSLQGQGGPELEALKGVTVPVRLSGPFDNIGYKVDLGGVVSDKAKERLSEKREELKGKAQEQLKDRLKDLLKR
jgi:AsmA protein